MTESPKAFMPYMTRALDFIEQANAETHFNGKV